jgi:hypothetical protein
MALEDAPRPAPARDPALPEDLPEDDNDEFGHVGFFDANDQEVPFDELIGMRGPLQHLLENVLTVLVSNTVFLCLFCLLPFTVGRVVINMLPYWIDALEFLALAAGVHERATIGLAGLSGALEGDAPTTLVGYCTLLAAGSAWALLALIFRDRYPGLATPLMVQVLAGLAQLYVFLKVTFLLFVELGAFPLFCGLWLDVCALDLVDTTLKARITFARESPLTCILLHWLAGIIYMLYVSLFISLLREVMRPGLFWFLRNPDDPNFHPFRDLVEESLPKHARRIVLSAMIYAPVIVMMVWAPVQLCARLAPAFFPLSLRFHDPYTEVPADIILFHVCVPFTIDHFHPRDSIKASIRLWAVTCGDWLAITRYIIPRPTEGQEPPADTPAVVEARAAAEPGEGAGADVRRQQEFEPEPEPKLGQLEPEAGGPARAELAAPAGAAEAPTCAGWHECAVCCVEFAATELEDAPGAGGPSPAGSGAVCRGCAARMRPEALGHAGVTESAAPPDAPQGAEQPGEETDPEAVDPPRPSFLVLRSLAFIFLGWAYLALASSALILVPTAIGRGIFAALAVPRSHDLYTFGLGCYCIWGLAPCLRHGREALARGRQRRAAVFREAARWADTAARVCLVGALGAGALPLLVGLLVELLVVIPLRVPLDETPCHHLYQDWALGLICLKVWVRIVSFGRDREDGEGEGEGGRGGEEPLVGGAIVIGEGLGLLQPPRRPGEDDAADILAPGAGEAGQPGPAGGVDQHHWAREFEMVRAGGLKQLRCARTSLRGRGECPLPPPPSFELAAGAGS